MQTTPFVVLAFKDNTPSSYIQDLAHTQCVITAIEHNW